MIDKGDRAGAVRPAGTKRIAAPEWRSGDPMPQPKWVPGWGYEVDDKEAATWAAWNEATRRLHSVLKNRHNTLHDGMLRAIKHDMRKITEEIENIEKYFKMMAGAGDLGKTETETEEGAY